MVYWVGGKLKTLNILVSVVIYELYNMRLSISELFFYNKNNLLYINIKIIYCICIKYTTNLKIKFKLLEGSKFWIKFTTGIN